MVLPCALVVLPSLVDVDRLVEVALVVTRCADLDDGPGVEGEHRVDALADHRLVGVLALIDEDDVIRLALDLGSGVGGLAATEAPALERDELALAVDSLIDLGIEEHLLGLVAGEPAARCGRTRCRPARPPGRRCRPTCPCLNRSRIGYVRASLGNSTMHPASTSATVSDLPDWRASSAVNSSASLRRRLSMMR